MRTFFFLNNKLFPLYYQGDLCGNSGDGIGGTSLAEAIREKLQVDIDNDNDQDILGKLFKLGFILFING